MIESRPCLVVQADATAATGRGECEAALATIDRHDARVPPGFKRTEG
jgi:hypothetical protein